MAKIKSTNTKKSTIKIKPAKAKITPPKKVKKAAVAAKHAAKKAVPIPKKIARKAPVAEVRTKKSGKPKDKLSPREEKIQQIRLKLLRQRETLLNEAESALNELPSQTIFPDLGDQATAETDRNFMLRLRGREQRLLKKIDEAIDRIESGTFGICDDCGNEIDVKRLEARPVTTMCIECKTLQEEEERMREQ
ncbi:MAG TPA: RNA polymerase-binding protein DksA [Candidatus Sulfobium mesophilum]|jgi:DnaK suppressor protein|nr:RNA polymerase-binding protein DksA [Candidatus Sulfobium mesophilum]